ncbi:MAG TPA: hypothetical protein VGE50_13515 [Gammaproteobacteria bacterium]
MFGKRKVQPAGPVLHAVSTFREGASRGLRYYWPLLLFILLSALSQIVGGPFSA